MSSSSSCTLPPVTEEQAALRLDKFLTQALVAEAAQTEGAPSLSRERIQALLASGHITKNGVPVTSASLKTKMGEIYTVTIPVIEKLDINPENIPLQILYEDEHLVVVNKPAGLSVHPAPTEHVPTLVHALLHHCGGSLSGIGGVERPGIVHRLDKGTSGVMVVAKTDAAHHGLSELFSTRTLERYYLALCYNKPKPSKGTIKTRIGRHPTNRKKMAVLPDNAEAGKEAVTTYETLETYAGGAFSLVKLKLQTGRTHQIRVHMQHIGCPVVGDPVYTYTAPRKLMDILSSEAKEAIRALTHQLLHATILGFVHPVTGEVLHFETAPPADMQDILSLLQHA